MARRNTHSRSLQGMVNNSANMFRSSLQWYEMMTASALTIGFRLGGISDSLRQNEQPDMPELLRMVSEKSSAWLQGGDALLRWQESIAKHYWRQSPAFWLVPTTATTAAAATSQLLDASTRWTALSLKGFSQVIKPYHTKSTANARRLSRKRPSG